MYVRWFLKKPVHVLLICLLLRWSLQYDPEGRMVVVDVKKDIGNRGDDLTRVGWYMEKDVSTFCINK